MRTGADATERVHIIFAPAAGHPGKDVHLHVILRPRVLDDSWLHADAIRAINTAACAPSFPDLSHGSP